MQQRCQCHSKSQPRRQTLRIWPGWTQRHWRTAGDETCRSTDWKRLALGPVRARLAVEERIWSWALNNKIVRTSRAFFLLYSENPPQWYWGLVVGMMRVLWELTNHLSAEPSAHGCNSGQCRSCQSSLCIVTAMTACNSSLSRTCP